MKHNKIIIPKGDVLIHTGDFVANMHHKVDLLLQFGIVFKWFQEMAKKFELVVFIAGNHETLLDSDWFDVREVKKMLKQMPENVIYLENS